MSAGNLRQRALVTGEEVSQPLLRVGEVSWSCERNVVKRRMTPNDLPAGIARPEFGGF